MTTFDTAAHPRITDGTFTDKPQSAPELTLNGTDPLEELVQIYIGRGYYSDSLSRDLAERYLADSREAGFDDQFLIDYERAMDLAGDRAYAPSMIELRDSGYTPADLAALFTHDDRKWVNNAHTFLTEGLTVEKIESLRAAGVPKRVDALRAFAQHDDDVASSWITTMKADYDLQRFVANYENIGALVKAGVSPEAASEFHDSGITPLTLAKHYGQISAAEARSYATTSGLKPELVGEYISHNIEHQRDPSRLVSDTTAKAYGPKFRPADVAQLASHGTDPKAARSLRGKNSSLTVEEVERLIKGGVTTASTYGSWRALTNPDFRSQVGSGRSVDTNPFSTKVPDQVKRIIAAQKSGATPAEAETYYAAGFKSPTEWKTLQKAGITDATEWTRALNGTARANRAVFHGAADHHAVAAEGLAAWAKAGGTPEGLATAQRAGIPITEAHKHINDPDLWESGTAYRAAVLEAEARARASWGDGSGKPWEWDASTYRG